MRNHKRIKINLFWLILLFSWTCSIQVNAWTYTGHVLIAQIAYDNLSELEKEKSNYYAKIIFDNLPKEMKSKLSKRYPGTSLFVKIAGLADYWKPWDIKKLFESYKADVPPDLLPYRRQKIIMWHYIDQPYPQVHYCPVDYSEGLVLANRLLLSSLRYKTNINTLSVLIALEEHFLGEIHQPLHTLTHVFTEDCLGDRGGNDFCLKLNSKGGCDLNLHQLWDSGLGYLKSNLPIQQVAYCLEKNYPQSIFVSQLSEGDPAQWAKENYQYANFIYNLSEHQLPPPNYYEQGIEITKRQIVLSGYRLSIVLSKLI